MNPTLLHHIGLKFLICDFFFLHACNVNFYMMQCSIWAVQVELPLRLINHHVIKTCRRLELQIRSFIERETDGGAPTAYIEFRLLNLATRRFIV
jgi:hypothetical protein